MGLLLGQAARPASSPDRQCPRLLLPVLEDVRRFSSRITPKSTLRNSCCPFLNVTLFRSSPILPSPDLNAIEHAWTLLKRQLRADYPDLINYPGGPEKVKAKLAEVLPLCWEKIPPKQFEALWRSMPSRVQAVIDAKGWYTRY